MIAGGPFGGLAVLWLKERFDKFDVRLVNDRSLLIHMEHEVLIFVICIVLMQESMWNGVTKLLTTLCHVLSTVMVMKMQRVHKCHVGIPLLS